MRRRGTGLAALLLATTVLAACSSTATPAPEPSVTTRTTAAGPTVLTFAVYGPPQLITAYTEIASDFTAAHPQVVVNVRPYETHAEAMRALEGGDEPDVFAAERSDLPRLVERDRIQPVDDLLAERGVDFGDGFQREALEAFSGDASLKCMPVDTSPMVVYYNKRRVDLTRLTQPGERPVSADTGWNLEQFATAARMASRGKVRGVYVAPSLEQIAPFVWSGGGDVVDSVTDPTTLKLSDGDSEKALEPLLELVRDPEVTFSQRQIAQRSALKRFEDGRLGMLLGYRDLTPILRQRDNLDFDVMPMPRQGKRATTGTMHGLCLAQGTEHAGAAADFIAYAVSDEPTALLASTGYVTPTNLDVVNSDAFLQPTQRPASATVFTRSTRYVQQLPVGEGWQHVDRVTRRMLAHLFYDPVIDPLEDRLAAIDRRSAALFARFAPPTETPSPTPTTTGSPTDEGGSSPSD